MLFELAFFLRKPVYEIENEMPHDEYIKWQVYLDMRPPDWRDDERCSKLLQAQGVKAKPEEMFDSLRRMKIKRVEAKDADQLLRGKDLHGSSMLHHMLSACGGDRPDFFKELT